MSNVDLVFSDLRFEAYLAALAAKKAKGDAFENAKEAK